MAVMRALVSSFLLVSFSNSSLAQGTIQLSNIGRDTVKIGYVDNPLPAPAGIVVQYATGPGEFVGAPATILGAGYFSAGSTTLEGLTGTVSLHLAVQYPDGWWAYSPPFEVTLGGARTPPSPPAALPPSFEGIGIYLVPEPSTYVMGVLGAGLFAITTHRRKITSF
jgi:hypothetical protein